jgi:hypothetical protein
VLGIDFGTPSPGRLPTGPIKAVDLVLIFAFEASDEATTDKASNRYLCNMISMMRELVK